MKRTAMDKKITRIVFGCMLILIMTVLFQRQEANAAAGSITAGNQDTVSVFDMKSSNLKDLTIASSNKNVKVKKKTYTDGGVKHTAVLAWAPYSYGEDATATVTVKYYDNKKKNTVSIKKKVNFLADYNGGYKTEQKLALNGSKKFLIPGSTKITNIYTSLYKYDSSMFAPFSGGGDGEEICFVNSSKKNRTVNIITDGYGMAECYIYVSFINGEYLVYHFNVIVQREDGGIFTKELKLAKDKSTVLYFAPPKSKRLSVKTDKEGIVLAKIMENQDMKEAALVLTGLKEGKTEVSLVYDADGKALVNKYIIRVVEQSPVEDEIRLTPKEEERSYSCIYQLTDSSGNLLKATTGTQYMEIVPDSPEVSVNSADWDYFDIGFSRSGTYHIAVRLKDLEGKTVEEYVQTIIADELKYSDQKDLSFSSEEEAKAYFCGENYRSWRSGEYSISFYKKGIITSLEDSNPWLFISGDFVPGDATYSIDIKQKKIIVKDYDRIVQIAYEIISKDHVRLMIDGRTRDFFYNSRY